MSHHLKSALADTRRRIANLEHKHATTEQMDLVDGLLAKYPDLPERVRAWLSQQTVEVVRSYLDSCGGAATRVGSKGSDADLATVRKAFGLDKEPPSAGRGSDGQFSVRHGFTGVAGGRR